MKVLRTISKVLILVPIAMLVYDLVNEWFVNARFKIQSLQEWLELLSPDRARDVRDLLGLMIDGPVVDKVMQAPGPLMVAVVPVSIYAVYWILFKLRGGRRAGKFTFKSHD